MVDATFRPFDSMRIALPLVFLLTLAPATAQSVTVNSTGITSDGRVLIDPGTGQARVIPPLLQPWQFGAVKLHALHKSVAAKPAETAAAVIPDVAPPPRKRKAAQPVETAIADAAPPTMPDTVPAPRQHKAAKAVVEASTPAPVQKPRRTASVTPPPAPPPSSSGFSGFGDLETLTTAPTQKPVETAKPAAKPQPVPAKPVAQPKPPVEIAKPAPKPEQRASLEPSKPRPSAGKARDTIAFAPNASDPSGTAVGSVRALAGALANSLGDANARIQLMAYAGQRGEKSSDTRRLSLKRALVVRQLLIDDGIPAERIDVFALGGVDDSGPLDRVDVFIKG